MDDFKAFIERLKEAAAIEEVVAETGKLTLVRSGKYWSTKEHDSLSIDPERGWFEWYSQGVGPGARGDVLEWLQHHGGLPDFMDAVRWLSERTGVHYDWSDKETQRYRRQQVRRQTLAVIAEYMAEKLWAEEDQQGLLYARQRGWTDETIRAAGLGYWRWEFNDGLRGRLQMHEIDPARPEAVAILGYRGDVLTWSETWGIAREQVDAAWIEKGRIPGAPDQLLIYPHMRRGRCVYLAGRRLDWKKDDQWPKSWNLRTALVGGRAPYWNQSVQADSDYVVVVEGQPDAITLAQWEIPAVALAGVSTSQALLEELQRFRRVYVALDPDAAGERGARALAKALGPGTPVVTWPMGGDANDWLRLGATADDARGLLTEAPIYALHMARQAHSGPRMTRDQRRREVYELIASLLPYDYANNRLALAVAMGHVSDADAPRPAELDKVIRAIKIERDLAAQGVQEAKPVREAPKVERPQIVYQELTEELKETLISQSRDHEGHARCVYALYGNRLAYVPAWGWLHYNGTHWEREGAEHRAMGLVVRTLKMRRHLGVEGEVEALVKATGATKSNVSGTQSLLERLVLATPDDFDQDKDLLNCANGVLNLRTGELLPHDSIKYRFTYCLPTPYIARADYSDWLVFLGEVTGAKDKNGIIHMDRELLDWLQEAVGYSLTGHTSEGCLFYLYGPTRSGKGTFSQTLQKLLGKPLSAGIDFNILVQQRNEDAQNFALAPLRPCRLLVGSEPGKYERFNEAKMKTLTGEDTVRCSFKNKDHFEYNPQYKIWLSSNWPFNADTADAAAWGRARIITFPNSFLGKEDKQLKARLERALPGVLAWAVEGAQRWYASERGLATPQAVEAEVRQQRTAQDYIQQFLDDCCVIKEDEFVSSKDLYESYKRWCAGELTPQKSRSFSLSLQAKGITPGRKYIMTSQMYMNLDGDVVNTRQTRGYYGVMLNENGKNMLLDISK